jgi:hypothetical protein
MESETDDEYDSRSSTDLLSSLTQKANELEKRLVEVVNEMKRAEFRMQSDLPSFETVFLNPKLAMRKWVETRGLSQPLTFHTFWNVFLHEHKQENRLVLSTRSIRLNKDASILLGYKGAEKEIPILEVLGTLPCLFY